MKRNELSSQFPFCRNIFNTSEQNSNNRTKNCRQSLRNRFDNDKDRSATSIGQKSDRSVLSVLSNDPRRVLRTGAEKITRTFINVRTTIGNFSQKFRPTTRRRQLLEEGPSTPCVTPHTNSKKILGRTPTKLYSPFGIETPKNILNEHNKENLPKSFPKNKLKKGLKLHNKTSKNLLNDCNSPSTSAFR